MREILGSAWRGAFLPRLKARAFRASFGKTGDDSPSLTRLSHKLMSASVTHPLIQGNVNTYVPLIQEKEINQSNIAAIHGSRPVHGEADDRLNAIDS